ncbi:MAG: S41 family peptidase [Ignavibacteria bacterium]|nr:S41 family peptidase [Ignavibacteria bacterium]MCU7504075.1 S41 family peptidase [Ignavibacteria bacterium]MCU7518256.1 S41 family peptidase [Ignavibacteria bacterium]
MWKWVRILAIPATIVIFSGFFKGDADIYFQISKSIDVFGKVYKEVSFNYVDELNPEEFMLSGINGMLSALDPYTTFIDEKRKGDIDLLTSGKYGGIGVSIGLRNEKVTIVDIIDGYSAQRQGLRIGDVITKINERDITKDNFEDISSLVKGDPGTEVQLTIFRDGTDQMVFNLVREEVKIKNVSFGGFVPESSNNVYLKLTGFTRTAGDEVQKTLTDLKSKKQVNSVILDLRGNPGGLLDAAVDVCEKFLKQNQLIVTVKGRDSLNFKSYTSTEEPVYGNSNLVVLIDSGSASASEIVAAAIQDHDRGVILGTDSFGKGLVQTVIPLSYNTSLKITTAKYYTPSGRCIQKIDYSKNNKVFSSPDSDIQRSYRTDHNRTVLAYGGIKPDTVVMNDSQSNVVNELSSRGLFFKFATEFSNLHGRPEYTKMNPEALYSSFMQFLKKEKFDYTPSAEKQLSELIATSEKENYNRQLISQLAALKGKFKEMKDFELNTHKPEMISSIKSELASRYEGSTGRIKETLKSDKQFQTALDIARNDKLYSHLLMHH